MQKPLEAWVQSLSLEDPLEEELATTPVLLPGKSHGQRSLAGCSPWVRKELGAPEEAAHPRAGPVHFLYPVISPWTCEWLHFLAVMNNAAVSAA